LDRDENAAKNILRIGLSTAGHTGTFGLEPINALGELTSTLTREILLGQVDSLNKESPVTSQSDVTVRVSTYLLYLLLYFKLFYISF
jgi:putative transposase